MKKGILIDFEGGEKVGKTSQLSRARIYLEKKGCKVVTSHEPGGGDPQIRQKLLDMKENMSPEEELDLFCEDRRLHVQNVIRPALNEGNIVLLDRFEPSTIAYQGYGRGLSLALIRERSAEARNGTWPDLIILFNADPTKVLTRAKATTRFDQENIVFHLCVWNGFLTQAAEDKKRWCVINATPSEEEVWQTVKQCLDKFISAHASSLSNP